MLVQRDIGRLVQYTLDMGGGAELLEVALRIPPWEPMRMLSRDELLRTRLDTSQDRIGQMPVAPASSSSSSGTDAPAAVAPASDGTRSETNNPLGWVLAERGGGAALVRQHPLTVEGKRIGTFELALGRGDGAADSTFPGPIHFIVNCVNETARRKSLMRWRANPWLRAAVMEI